MSETKWTPEPWFVDEVMAMVRTKTPYPSKQDYICSMFDQSNDMANDWTDIDPNDNKDGEITANARRIVQCVNALAGMESPETEIPALKARVSALQDSLDLMTVRAHDAEAQAEQLDAATEAWERAMMEAIGEDGVKSVSDAIGALKTRVKELEAELAHTIMDPLAALINGKAKAEAQRDALYIAMKKILDADPELIGMPDEFRDEGRYAIAKAEGE